MIVTFMMIMKKQMTDYVREVLSNDEVSTDEELVTLFMKEEQVSLQTAKVWVLQREFYLNNIVMKNGKVWRPTK